MPPSGSGSLATGGSESDGSSSGSEERDSATLSSAATQRAAGAATAGSNGSEGKRREAGTGNGMQDAEGQSAGAAGRRGPARSGRRVGRLYAATKARHEYKLLLRTAEELLLLYSK